MLYSGSGKTTLMSTISHRIQGQFIYLPINIPICDIRRIVFTDRCGLYLREF